MKISDFEVGYAIRYMKYNQLNELKSYYGLVIEVFDKKISFVAVSNIMRWLPNSDGYYKVLCYDDVGACGCDKNNVRLRKCPPPFSELSNGVKEDLYAVAVRLKYFNQSDIDKYHVILLDGGIKVDGDVIDEIKNRLVITQPQKEFTHHGYRQGSDKVADIGTGDDIQFDV